MTILELFTFQPRASRRYEAEFRLGRTAKWLACKTLPALLLAIAGSAHAAPEGVACAPMPRAQEDVVEVMRQMYAALQSDDLDAFQSRVTPDYFAFDGGVRYTAKSLVDVIKDAHAKGMKFEWTVGTPEVHVSCNQAWLTYTNRGSVDVGKGKTPTEWLESAIMEYREGVWRIRFFHSTSVPAKS